MANDPIHETKKTLSVFNPSKASPLKYTDLMVYCFRAFQDNYGTIPSCRRIAKNTGLREQTVAEATERLHNHRLLTGDGKVISPCPRADWFIPLERLQERFPEGPAFRWFQNWTTLIRSPGMGNPISVPAVLVYSLVRHSIFNNWKPSQGWTLAYLAELTATNEKTVGAALSTLEEAGFLTVLQGMRFKIYRLSETQLKCFADRGVWSGNSAEPDEIVDELAPAAVAFDEKMAAKAGLVELSWGA
jgi:DNA-binding transcriptional regulator YhcF (GntR family)